MAPPPAEQGYGSVPGRPREPYTIRGTVTIADKPKFAPAVYRIPHLPAGETPPNLNEVPRDEYAFPDVLELLMMVFFPWFLFVFVYASMAFSMRMWAPAASWFFFAVGVVLVILSGAYALLPRRTGQRAGNPCTMFALMLLALVLATFYGDRCFHFYVEPHIRLRELNVYKGVDPGNAAAARVGDAGQVHFTPAARVDSTMAMGFRSHHTFCVAPITNKPLVPTGNATTGPAEYNFWAVGIDCCSGDQHRQDFQCGDVENDMVHAGLRMLQAYDIEEDETQKMFKLAVMQAEAVYNIKAPSPLFLRWMLFPAEGIDRYMADGVRSYFVWVLYYLLFQASFQIVLLCCYPAFVKYWKSTFAAWSAKMLGLSPF